MKLFFLERRPLAPDLLSKLILLFMGLSVVQIANPRGGGVLVGMRGLLYVTVPLMWFFIGRELLDQSATVRLMRLVVVLGVVVAAYGLLQSQLVHPVWDRAWVDQVATVRGYSSLNVGGTLRSFGTFSSSGEYAALRRRGSRGLLGSRPQRPSGRPAPAPAPRRGSVPGIRARRAHIHGIGGGRPDRAEHAATADRARRRPGGHRTRIRRIEVFRFGSGGSGQQLEQRPREPSARRGDGPLESEQLDPVDSRSGGSWTG